jgi:hypothetical protein
VTDLGALRLGEELIQAVTDAGDSVVSGPGVTLGRGERVRGGERHPTELGEQHLGPQAVLAGERQRGLGHEQAFGRAGQVAFGGDGGEVAQQPGIDIHAIRLWMHVLDTGPGAAEA